MIPVDYNLFCKIGKTLYSFNGIPDEELLDEDGDLIVVAPCVILDYMVRSTLFSENCY